MSCNCHQYAPCDPICPSCGGTTTSSTTTTTTICPSAIKCVEYKKDICVVHPGDPCYLIKEGTDLNTLIVSILTMLPTPPGCSTTTTTTKPVTTTSTTTIVPTTTTTTCVCPSTTTSTSTTTTTTLGPCDCLTFTIKNITTSTQTYSYENCSHVQINNVSIAAGVTQIICVCNENLIYDRTKFIVIATGQGCNTSTTTSTSTSTTSTTSTSTTTTTTNPCPACNSYKVQSLSLPASWSGKTCTGGTIVAGTFTAIGQSITTPCICSTSLVLSNTFIKETTNCIGTTTTSTSTSTTSTTTAAPSTTTTTIACLQYVLSSPTGGYARGISCTGNYDVVVSVPILTPVVTPCIQVGSLILSEAGIDYTIPCGGTTSTTTSTPTTTTTLPACECFSIENPTEFTEGAVIIPCGSSSPLEVSVPAFSTVNYCVKYETVPYEQSGSSLNIVRCYTFTCASNVDCTGCIDTTTTTTEIPTTTTTTI